MAKRLTNFSGISIEGSETVSEKARVSEKTSDKQKSVMFMMNVVKRNSKRKHILLKRGENPGWYYRLICSGNRPQSALGWGYNLY